MDTVIQKDQLYPERSFIRFCMYDEFSRRKIDHDITQDFLDACEKDQLIVPLLIEKETMKTQEGVNEEVNVRYYSPFQIYLVACLASNSVDPDGWLRGTNVDFSYQAGHKTRYIDWSGGGFNADTYKAKKTEEQENDIMINNFVLADDFHNLLRLLHGLDQRKGYWEGYEHSIRLFTRMPKFEYDLDAIRQKGLEYLVDYNLSIKKLKIILKNVGQFATHIDPLDHWFYYIQRHSRRRRDQLKGPVAVAQDLYGLCDVIQEIIEATTAERPRPLLDIIHRGFRPFLMEGAEYASGSDIKTIKSARDNFEVWIRNHKDLIEEVAAISDQGKQIKSNIDAQLKKAAEDLDDFEKRYGDVRCVGSMRTILPEEKLKLADLDNETRKWVIIIMKQINPSYRETDPEFKRQITFAIERRLDDLAREVSDPAHGIAEALWHLHYKIKHEKETNEPYLWSNFDKSLDPQSPDYATRRVNFWHKELKELQKPYDDKLKEIDQAQKELHSISNQTRLVFCADCRQQLVMLHHSYNDRQISSEAVCDSCFEAVADNALEADKGRWNAIKYGEWRCQCGKLLYKFALGNVISLRTEGGVPIKVELPYGRAILEARCLNCNETDQRSLDWGWQA